MQQPRPLKTTADCRKAVSAFNIRDFKGALEAITKCQSVYAESVVYHNAVAFLHYKLATQSKDLDTVRKSLSDAAVSAHRAWNLSRNSIFLAHFRASMLYLLLAFDKNYDEVIQECQQALAIKDPKDPDRDLFFFRDWRQKMKVDQMMEELRALINHCEMKKSWFLVNPKERYKECMKEIEKRVKRAKNGIKLLSDSPDTKCESVSLVQKVEDRRKKQALDLKNAMANLDKEQDGKSFWSSEMSLKEKQNLCKVSIEDLKTHLHSLKEHMEMDLVLEAIDFAKMWKAWKFWECFLCCNKFSDFGSYTKHLGRSHDWKIPLDILPFLPTDIDDFSLEIIVKGGWKPVDINEAIKIAGRTLLFSSKTDENGSLCNLEWPLCDDSARTEHLEKVCGMLQLLLRHKCLMQYNVDMVINITIQELKDTIPQRLLMTGDLKTLKLVCFLGSSQFQSIFHYLQDLFYVLISSENPEMGNSMDEQPIDDQGFDIKEKVILSKDLSFLLLDGSALTSANSVHGDGVPHASGENLSMSSFSAGHEVGKELESWKSKRDSQISQAMELFYFFEEERSHLVKLHKERQERLRKLEAVNEVSISCGMINREEQDPENRRTYECRLRELRKALLLQFQERNNDTENASEIDIPLKFKLDFISHILEIHQIKNAYKFDYWSLSDDSLQKIIEDCGLQLSRDVYADNAIMKRSVDLMKHYSQQLGHISVYDYQSIMLPVLKSFIQATGDIGQPLLPQEEVEQTDDPNREIGPSGSANEAALDVCVLVTGLTNEALDCILNMIIQSLWNLREFPEEFMNRSKSHPKHISSCVVCAFKEIFEGLHKRKPVAPASLRNALIVSYHDKIKSCEGQMENASKFLPIILESLHGLLISDLKLGEKAYLDCFLADCFVHRIFGMDHHERINCVKCKVESMHQKYSSLYLSLSADNLRMKKSTYGEKSSDELLKLEMNRQVTCKHCGQENNIYHTLRRLPHVFTIVLVWEKPDESCDGISRILRALSSDLDLRVLFQRCQPDNKYFLVSLICCSGAREYYKCFIYKQELEKYVEHNDNNEKVIGSWEEVIDTCVKGCWQPTILFFHKKSRM